MSKPPLNLQVTLAGDENHAEIRSFVDAIRREFGIAVPAPDSDLQSIEANYQQRGGALLLVRDQRGQLLGTLGFTTILPGEYELRKFYFVPELRGQGIGRVLLEGVIGLVIARGAHAIELETRSFLEAACMLYRSVGFKVSGQNAEQVTMRLELATKQLRATR